MASEETPPAEGAAQPKKGKKPLVLILALVLILGGGGGGAYFFLFAKKGDPKKDAAAEQAEVVPVLKTFALETFIVNLATSGNFLKATLEVEYDQAILDKLTKLTAEGGAGHGGGASGGGAEPAGGPPPLVSNKLPMVRDAVIAVLSAKTGEEVLQPAARESLKQELVDAINEAIGLDEPSVVNVYFVEFVVQ